MPFIAWLPALPTSAQGHICNAEGEGQNEAPAAKPQLLLFQLCKQYGTLALQKGLGKVKDTKSVTRVKKCHDLKKN